MAPVAVPDIDELSLSNGNPSKHIEKQEGEDVEEDEDEEVDGIDGVANGGQSMIRACHASLIMLQMQSGKRRRRSVRPRLSIML